MKYSPRIFKMLKCPLFSFIIWHTLLTRYNADVGIHNQSRNSRTPYLPIGGATLSQGAQNSVLLPLSTPEKASIPKLKYEVLDYVTNGIQWWPITYISNYLPKSTVSQKISCEIGLHTQTALYPIPRYIGPRYVGAGLQCSYNQWRN